MNGNTVRIVATVHHRGNWSESSIVEKHTRARHNQSRGIHHSIMVAHTIYIENRGGNAVGTYSTAGPLSFFAEGGEIMTTPRKLYEFLIAYKNPEWRVA